MYLHFIVELQRKEINLFHASIVVDIVNNGVLSNVKTRWYHI